MSNNKECAEFRFRKLKTLPNWRHWHANAGSYYTLLQNVFQFSFFYTRAVVIIVRGPSTPDTCPGAVEAA